MDASDNEILPVARHGQNDPAMALGRRNWTFAGSERGADRAAIMLTLITTARLNDIAPKTWPADVLAHIAETPVTRLHDCCRGGLSFAPADLNWSRHCDWRRTFGIPDSTGRCLVFCGYLRAA